MSTTSSITKEKEGFCIHCKHQTNQSITLGLRSKDVNRTFRQNVSKIWLCKKCNNARATGIRQFLRQHGIY